MLPVLVSMLFVAGSLAALGPQETALSDAEQSFSLKMLDGVIGTQDQSQNIIFSPYSVYNALLTIYVASAGKTEKSLEHNLFDEKSKPSKEFITKRFLNEATTNHSKEYQLTSLDRIFYSSSVKVKPDKEKLFHEKIAVFKTQDKHEDEINKWVSDHTNGLIKELFKKGSLTRNDKVVMVNAAHFKGSWTKSLTGPERNLTFTLSNGTNKETLFMSVPGGFGQFQIIKDTDLKADIMNLPYKGGDISMIIFLTSKKPGNNVPSPLEDVIKKLTKAKFQQILSSLKATKSECVDVLIPKFKIEKRYNLKTAFEAMGIKELFTTDQMDLSNLFEPGQSYNTNSFVHVAKVNVYENGTEAAAATAETAGAVQGYSPPTCPRTFHADHPFFFIIYDWKNRFAHYVGVVRDPKDI